VTKFLFITDLDDTLVGDDDAMAFLNRQLSLHREAYGTKIVYSTGRSFHLYRQLRVEKSLLKPDILVTGVGTQIYHDGSDEPDSIWAEKLRQSWDREAVVSIAAHFSDLVPQRETEQNHFKVSYCLTSSTSSYILSQMEAKFKERGVQANLVYCGGKYLDILPHGANKGLAMLYLRQHYGFEPSQTVVCGDSGNDIAMFHVAEERGIIVGNAMSELQEWHGLNPAPHRYLAKAHCAGGILEGLKYFGFL
jgi:hypothetical protein